jgi:hypothetical protein
VDFGESIKRCIVIAEGWAMVDISINLLKADMAYYFFDEIVDVEEIVLTLVVSYSCFVVDAHVEYYCKITVDLIVRYWALSPGVLSPEMLTIKLINLRPLIKLN